MKYANDFWAITTFYNPAKYKRRLINYKVFKQNLNLPLLTVELSFNNEFELGENDSEILIQLTSNSVLWQKERLLNVALTRIPKSVKYIAWLDCDVIFENKNWINLTIEKLKTFPIIQLFSELYDLKTIDKLPSFETIRSYNKPTGYSIAFLSENNIQRPEDFRPTTTPSMRRGLFGLAWAARKEVLIEFGFYDAMILGSGDRGFACAGYGRFHDFIKTTHLNEIRIEHYMKWAVPFYNCIQGKIGHLEGGILHLWHGDLKNRKYMERHIEFIKYGFNPMADLRLSIQGCWEWNTDNEELKQFAENYFLQRKEDDSQQVN